MKTFTEIELAKMAGLQPIDNCGDEEQEYLGTIKQFERFEHLKDIQENSLK